MKRYYLNIGRASDLKNFSERKLYRALEILPGFLALLTFFIMIFFSWLKPVWVAFFIIAFDIYWFLRTIYLFFYLRASYSRMKKNLKKDWLLEIQAPNQHSRFKDWQEIYHLIILPFYKEPYDVLDETLKALVRNNYPKNKLMVVLASEERAGEEAQKIAEQIQSKYGHQFFQFLITCHPAGIKDELAGKGSNETWAGQQAKKMIDQLGLSYENIIVSVFDIDTRVYPEYFGCLTYHFLLAKKPCRTSYQPVPIYNNNIWQAPAISRVVSVSGTFWHMMQQERPGKLATFSSHAMSFKALVELDFWNTKNVSEDSRIFWKALLFYDGDYRVVPLYYPVSMDANLAENFWKTMINIYKQQRRWGWGVENIPYLIFGCLKNKKMPLIKKIRHISNNLEAFWSWATNAILIFLLGWLPLFLGGERFNVMVLSYNLPRLTQNIMALTMIGLVASAIYSAILLPPRPPDQPRRKHLYMILQWVFLPVAILVFGALPGLDAQVRLLSGKYMGFWATPKTTK